MSFRASRSTNQPTSVKKPIMPIIAVIPVILSSVFLGLAFTRLHVRQCRMGARRMNYD
jgi:hypothetical protein